MENIYNQVKYKSVCSFEVDCDRKQVENLMLNVLEIY